MDAIYMILNGYGSIPINTIFSGMNIHKSQLFWGSLGTRVLTHPQMILNDDRCYTKQAPIDFYQKDIV